MELTPYIASLREQLAVAVESGGPEARALAERLAAALEPAARLALLEALSAAAAEITQEIAPGSVEVRLRGRDPEFAVVLPTPTAPEVPVAFDEVPPPAGDDAATARINLRLPQELKDRVEESARASGVSVNTWLVRAASAATSRGPVGAPPSAPPGGVRFSGWVR
jgi:hypothetical protein